VKRELQLALLLVLAGACLVLLAAGRHWVDVLVPQAAPLSPRHAVSTGNDVVAALRPLGLVGLAGVAALAATRDRGRVVVGVLLLAAGAAVVAATVGALRSGARAALTDRPAAGAPALPDGALGFTGWPWPALVGGVLLALGGLAVAVRGRRWAALSARYDVPAARAQRPSARPEVAAWDALDRGEDPTGDPRPRGNQEPI